MPGLAAGPEIFENINLDKSLYELHLLQWIKPLALEETITNYAMRMCYKIEHKKF